MKQTILNQPIAAFSRKLVLCAALCVLAAAATLGVNLLLAFTFTAETRQAFLLTNIVTDAVTGCALLAVTTAYLLPRRKLLQLARQRGSERAGVVERISAAPLRYLGVDCLEVAADGRRLFLPCGTIRLEEGAFYRFRTVSNVITEAEQ